MANRILNHYIRNQLLIVMTELRGFNIHYKVPPDEPWEEEYYKDLVLPVRFYENLYYSDVFLKHEKLFAHAAYYYIMRSYNDICCDKCIIKSVCDNDTCNNFIIELCKKFESILAILPFEYSGIEREVIKQINIMFFCLKPKALSADELVQLLHSHSELPIALSKYGD